MIFFINEYSNHFAVVVTVNVGRAGAANLDVIQVFDML